MQTHAIVGFDGGKCLTTADNHSFQNKRYANGGGHTINSRAYSNAMASFQKQNMREIDFVGELHKKSTRDYLARVNDQTYPKYKAAELAKKYDIDYWDGDRRICYGGYKYIEGWWEVAVRKMLKYYQLPKGGKILDVGCGKGYMLYDFKKIRPDLEVTGIDISKYAIKNGDEDIKDNLMVGNAKQLPWENNPFDLVIPYITLSRC